MIQNKRYHLNRLTDCLNTVRLSVCAEEYISRVNIYNGPIIIILAAAAHDIIGFRIALVLVYTDLASRVYRRMGKDSALLIHLCRTFQKAPNSDLSYSVERSRLLHISDTEIHLSPVRIYYSQHQNNRTSTVTLREDAHGFAVQIRLSKRKMKYYFVAYYN